MIKTCPYEAKQYGWMFKTVLNIEISVIEIYLYFGACNLLFLKKALNA